MAIRDQIVLTDLDSTRLRSVASELVGQHGEAHSRGLELHELLDCADVIPAGAVAPDVVTMNSTVMYDDGSDGPVATITLVYPEQADAALGRVSVLSPLGLALIGMRAGEQTTFGTPRDGERVVRVRKVLRQPKVAGERTS
jgi:regulator of nucleoside diphosphate kinase